ncbi:gluconate 5-dehydrogenase/3-oxoacyl-[acyl-carrier protein] reductase [Sphingobium sp. YR657]|uniref:SDR family NAD(P)-dependent oxidoreductase n=1 Tax=Sphingobium sp. YR657 TaxID=1884366 RepID=UPI00091FF99A|nr:SDR family NAD(P)-dependent oxidoreductase [Sphingobium sp. YR657]SHM46098.1 gluconate 5-dehydrogenase/3-oxoacyl-[acyl-carrier protein] reductase [Sphingobium sp. YR657]
MTDKLQALVTGANKGIGLAIAKGLASAGLSVWMGARDRSRGEEAVKALKAEGLDVRFIEIDVADDASVRRAAETVGGEVDALHVLVNNAGIVLDLQTVPSELSMDDVKATYEVNLFGPIRVTQAFASLLKGGGRCPDRKHEQWCWFADPCH